MSQFAGFVGRLPTCRLPSFAFAAGWATCPTKLRHCQKETDICRYVSRFPFNYCSGNFAASRLKSPLRWGVKERLAPRRFAFLVRHHVASATDLQPKTAYELQNSCLGTEEMPCESIFGAARSP